MYEEIAVHAIFPVHPVLCSHRATPGTMKPIEPLFYQSRLAAVSVILCKKQNEIFYKFVHFRFSDNEKPSGLFLLPFLVF
jgi:hypothetical protein